MTMMLNEISQRTSATDLLNARYSMTMSSSSLLPYSMCFREECDERQGSSQVSEFEATLETRHHRDLTKRILDPCLAVTKYRRSAAGDTRNERPARSLQTLRLVWRHLSNIFVHQTAHYDNDGDGEPVAKSRSSLLATVSFIDDRVRALQVDLVVSQQACASMQLQLVRYHVLCLYLLTEMDRKQYEPTFARQALWTALSAYWDDTSHRTDEGEDEVLCYTALLHIASCLQQEHGIVVPSASNLSTSHQGYGAVLVLALKRRQRPSTNDDHQNHHPSYPRFHWALKLTAAAQMGLHRVVLAMLADNDATRDDTRFATLCRCAMAPALNVLRMGSVMHYNTSFGKREGIAAEEMARLLFLPSAESALDFCRNLGLPVDDDNKVLMKAAPVAVQDETLLPSLGRQEDALVFGTVSGAWVENGGDDSACVDTNGRVDQEGVLIPPRRLLETLIVSGSGEARHL